MSTATTTEVRIRKCEQENRPLWQTDYYQNLYDAWLELDEDGLVYVYTYPSGRTPESNWHQRDARWRICPFLAANAADRLMDECLDDLKRVHAGREIVWDGNNWIGEYNADAIAAMKDIEQLCDLTNDGDIYQHDAPDDEDESEAEDEDGDEQ